MTTLALRDLNSFSDAEIQAPIRQAPNHAPATVPVVQTQNRLPDIVGHRCRVSEQIQPKTGRGGAVRTRNVVVHAGTGGRPNRDGVSWVSCAEEVSETALADDC